MLEASPLVLALRFAAFVLLLVAAASVPTGRVALGWLALALFVLSFIVG